MITARYPQYHTKQIQFHPSPSNFHQLITHMAYLPKVLILKVWESRNLSKTTIIRINFFLSLSWVSTFSVVEPYLEKFGVPFPGSGSRQ
jgi:hypothetical protein